MVTSQEWLNPTQAIGLAAYGTAVTCCATSWIRMRGRGEESRLAAVVMLIESALLLDIAFNWRWKLHQAVMDFAIRNHEYAERGLPQLVAVTILLGLLFSGWIISRRAFRKRAGAQVAVSGVVLSLFVWCVEVVSLHAVDHVLYSSRGGFMAITLLWILACTMTSIGILRNPSKA